MAKKRDSDRVRILVLRGVDGSGGGADKIILRTAASIDRTRFQMRLCFMRHVNDPDFDFDQRCAQLGLDYCEVRHQHPLDRSVRPGIEAVVDEFQPQVMHSHDYKANFFNRWVARKKRNRMMATSHGWTGDGIRERFLYYPGDKLVLRSFDHIVAVSDDIRQQLLRWGCHPSRVQVVLNGVDPADYVADALLRKEVRTELGISSHELVLGAVGRVERQKRFDVMLEAISYLRKKNKQIKLLIAGEGSRSEEINNLIVSQGLQQHCQMLGHCADMKRIYQSFDLLVQSSDYEGTPTVVVEAMALGIPVVATDAGGTSQLMTHGEHGLIVPCRSPVELAEAILLTDREKEATKIRIAKARQRVETELSFDVRLKTLEGVYEQLAKGR